MTEGLCFIVPELVRGQKQDLLTREKPKQSFDLRVWIIDLCPPQRFRPVDIVWRHLSKDFVLIEVKILVICLIGQAAPVHTVIIKEMDFFALWQENLCVVVELTMQCGCSPFLNTCNEKSTLLFSNTTLPTRIKPDHLPVLVWIGEMIQWPDQGDWEKWFQT